MATVARFAIERERLAREMGVDELGGPATLGVVNVGAAVTYGQQQQQYGYRNNAKGGGRGNKRARSHQRTGGKEGAVDGVSSGSRGGGGGIGGRDSPASEDDVPAAERRSASEVLLEKLESVAEARSIESAGGGPGGRGDRAEEDGNWRAELEEEESSTFRYSAGERGAGAGGGPEAAWGAAAPAAGELSTTESAFLERSRRASGLDGGGRGGGDSMFGHHFEAGFREASGGGGADIGGGGSGGGGHVATIGVLRDRLATVEGENTALRSRARRAEEERAAEAARGDRACKKLAQVGGEKEQHGSCMRNPARLPALSFLRCRRMRMVIMMMRRSGEIRRHFPPPLTWHLLTSEAAYRMCGWSRSSFSKEGLSPALPCTIPARRTVVPPLTAVVGTQHQRWS